MPELPEVEIVRRGLEQALLQQSIKHVEISRYDLRVPIPPDFATLVAGRRIEKIQRRGKYIIMIMDGAHAAVWHLGMSGRVYIHPADMVPERLKHDHVVMHAANDTCVVFNDPRRFGMLYLSNASAWEKEKPFVNMGPEPLGNSFNGPVLQERLKGRRTPIKVALLDQAIVAGVGNIYACEALYEAGINPQRPACDLDTAETDALARAVKLVLERAIAAGGSTLKDYHHTDGTLGYFQYHFSVYDREGDPCPDCSCREKVQRIVQAGRSTFYCKKRQK